MNIVVFEDAGTEKLFPITTGRLAYAITCGTFRLVDWLDEMEGHLVGLVRSYLTKIQRLDFPQFNAGLDDSHDLTLVFNARLVPSRSNIQLLKSFITDCGQTDCGDRPRIVRSGWAVAAAVIPTDKVSEQADLLTAIEDYCNGAIDPVETADVKLRLFDYPHDVIRENMESIGENLEFRLQQEHDFQQTNDGLFVAPGVELGKHVVIDASDGPIVIDRNAKIGPFCFLRGPVYVGPNAKVIEHSAIKDGVSLAHTTKVGGEVEGSVIEAFSNKQHHGFLGHSYLGSWINLGAGTCNSDLKNTYGEVKVEYGDTKIETGMQFVGCMIGDYAKTAINTSIFTGKTIGACSMLYGFVTTNVPSFVNYARSFGQTTEMPPAVMVSTQKRMFGRRNVEQRPCDIQLLHEMYRLTAGERQLSESPLSF